MIFLKILNFFEIFLKILKSFWKFWIFSKFLNFFSDELSCLLATSNCWPTPPLNPPLNDGHVSKKLWPPDIHQHFYSKKSINRLILSEYYSAPCYFSCNNNLCVHPGTSILFRNDKRIINLLECFQKSRAASDSYPKQKDTLGLFSGYATEKAS